MKLKELLKLIPALPWHLTVEEDSNSDGITENVAVIYDDENLGEEIVRTVTHSDAPDEGTVHEGAMLNAKYLHHAANTLPMVLDDLHSMLADALKYPQLELCDHHKQRLIRMIGRIEDVKMENDGADLPRK